MHIVNLITTADFVTSTVVNNENTFQLPFQAGFNEWGLMKGNKGKPLLISSGSKHLAKDKANYAD